MNGTRLNCMTSHVIFSKCPGMMESRNHEIKRTCNTFQDCHMHFLPTTFLEIAVLILNFAIAHFQVAFYLYFKTSRMQNFYYKNEFDLHENKLVGETHFHNGFARKLVFTVRQRELGNGLFCQETGKKMSSYVVKVEIWGALVCSIHI